MTTAATATHTITVVVVLLFFAFGVVVNIVVIRHRRTKKPCTDFVPHKAFVALFVVKQS